MNSFSLNIVLQLISFKIIRAENKLKSQKKNLLKNQCLCFALQIEIQTKLLFSCKQL